MTAWCGKIEPSWIEYKFNNDILIDLKGDNLGNAGIPNIPGVI
jgi:hypothetical protein